MGVLHPRRLPHGECGVWGSAPGSGRLHRSCPTLINDQAALDAWRLSAATITVREHRNIKSADRTQLSDANLGIWLPFLIAAGIKTAQGSSTVAIITTAGLLAPLLETLGLASDTHRALVVIAIGAGAMVVSHANDSYFWVVTQFSGMDVKTGYKLQTLGTLVQGSVAALAVYLVSIMVL